MVLRKVLQLDQSACPPAGAVGSVELKHTMSSAVFADSILHGLVRVSESSKKEVTVNGSDEWRPLADLLADLIAKYADEINFEELPDPEKFLLVRTMKEYYKRYTAKRNRYLKEHISLEYVLTDS